MYDMKTEITEDNIFHAIIHYYDFDKYELINQILSFDHSVRIISPQDIIEKVKERINIGYI